MVSLSFGSEECLVITGDESYLEEVAGPFTELTTLPDFVHHLLRIDPFLKSK